MVAIRLARGGTKKRPFYHIIVTDSRNRRDGRYIERIGFFNPIAAGQEESLRIDQPRLKYWLAVGAQPSERVEQLVKQSAKNAPVTEPVIVTPNPVDTVVEVVEDNTNGEQPVSVE